MSGLPDYVEYGGRATSPGPFRQRGGHLRGYVLEGSRTKIDRLVRRVLDEPAGDACDYEALGSYVTLLVGAFDDVSATTPPFDTWGSLQEVQLSFWVPVAAARRTKGRFVAERLCLAVPYIWVDNPMSYLGGRELYGYAKSMGRFDPPDGDGDVLRLQTYGGAFGKGSRAGWKDLVEIAPADDGDGGDDPPFWEAPAGLVKHLTGSLFDAVDGDDDVEVGGLTLLADVARSALAGDVRQVFLKQFRDAEDGTKACYRAVVEAPLRFTKVRGRPSLRAWDVDIHRLDTHPIAEELGVRSQRAVMAFRSTIDFVVEPGEVIGEPEGALPGG